MKMMTIAKIGIKECLRQRVVYGIFIMAILFILLGKGCNPGKIRGNDLLLDKEAKQSLIVNVAFHGLVLWSIMLSGLLSASVLSKEFEDGTALMTLSRPLSRGSFVAGKILSCFTVSVLNLFLLWCIFIILVDIEIGIQAYRMLTGLIFVVISLAMYTLMNCFLSLFIPRLIIPLITFLIYGMSCWASLPFYFNKLRLVWVPSETVNTMHNLLPRFGDLQFIAASCMDASKTAFNLTALFGSVLLYCLCFWSLIVFVINRRQI